VSAVTRVLVVPAAGLGTRLGASRPKPLVEVNGQPMLLRLLELFSPFVERAVVVVHPSFAAAVRSRAAAAAVPLELAEQAEPTGMLDAILAAAPAARVQETERVWIAWCDQIALRRQTLEALSAAEAPAVSPPGLLVPTARVRTPYIHLRRDAAGRVTEVLQRREGDVLPEDGENDVGLFSLSRDAYATQLPLHARQAAVGRRTGERNFLPFLSWMAARGGLGTLPVALPIEALGVNTPADLARVEAELAARGAE
jgi:bifunctional N-acetylglucosamine-1-phosphate-uridyltransferase/glucosamine-1-phosphate-acetyltransferase GlmU-like protein